MSKNILNKLDELEQELSTLERSLLERRTHISLSSQTSESQVMELQRSLKEEKVKNKKVSDILSKSIMKLEKVIEKEEKHDA